MISVISGTNRPHNTTLKIAQHYFNVLKKRDQEVSLLSILDLPHDFAFNNDVYGERNADFSKTIREHIVPAEKLVIVSPEYNGSFPGVLKSFIDGIWPENLKGKKAALVGVASGRAGNLRGMEHMTGILHYLSVHVLPMKLAISKVDKIINDEGELTDEKVLGFIERQVDALIDF
ncbi:MAG TPA: NADPH-dependent FMN reductase [Flavobacteriales bacterium]|jgi:chromate reductase|nr:NADPH-dependent FMN reductase [Flavobacteriales bacterium]